MNGAKSATLYHGPHATSEREGPINSSCSKTPMATSDNPRTLRRTISYASIDTVRPSTRLGIRQRITEIAGNLKRKAPKNTYLTTQAVPDKSVHNPASDSKSSSENEPKSSRRKATAPLQVSSQKPADQCVVVIPDRLHSGVPPEVDTKRAALPRGDSDFLIDESLPDDVGFGWDCVTIGIFEPEPQVDMQLEGILRSLGTPKVGIEDIQLNIRSSESDVTIWDGLQAPHHLFKCRLFLRCTTHPYDAVCLPGVGRIEMDCNTCPVGSRYARPSVLQATYSGASPGMINALNGLPDVSLAAGIHVDKFWRTTLNDDGSWGWCKDVFVPLSPRLFDKIEYREFRLVSRVWMEESCLESELTFGVSMLLREVDMK